MALGGGTFNTQNKVLPGSYINFISAGKADASISERGVAAMALELDWGVEGEVFTIEAKTIQENCLKTFAYNYDHKKMKGIRELFRFAKTAHLYRLNKGVKASNDFATAKYSGIRGNDITTVIQTNIEDINAFDVITLLDFTVVDKQTVKEAAALVGNDYVDFKADAVLETTAGVKLTLGTNGEGTIGSDYQLFLNAMESYSYNTLGCLSNNAEIIALYIAFTKRMRDEIGAKFQTIVYRTAGDHEGIINLENKVLKDDEYPEYSLIYWLTGVEAACPVNKDNTNKKYDGEFDVDVAYRQTELADGIRSGKLMFHKVGSEVHLLEDINSYVSFTDDKNSDFASNQTIRVLDQIGNDIAVLFNTRFLGVVANDDTGRLSLWNQLVTYYKELEKMRVIENFKADDLIVEKGSSKRVVVITSPITPINAMKQLYMTVIVE